MAAPAAPITPFNPKSFDSAGASNNSPPQHPSPQPELEPLKALALAANFLANGCDVELTFETPEKPRGPRTPRKRDRKKEIAAAKSKSKEAAAVAAAAAGDDDEPGVKRRETHRPRARPMPRQATTLSTTEERAALAAFEAQNTKIVNKLMHCLNSSTRQWARHEWFYSSLDRDYFNNNEFQTMLDMSNLDHVEKVTE